MPELPTPGHVLPGLGRAKSHGGNPQEVSALGPMAVSKAQDARGVRQERTGQRRGIRGKRIRDKVLHSCSRGQEIESRLTYESGLFLVLVTSVMVQEIAWMLNIGH